MKWFPVVFLTACSLSGNRFPPELPLESEFATCEVDTDCVIVELGCCDACNGGLAVASNVASREEVERLYSERCRGNVGCTLIGCPGSTAECGAGNTCEVVPGTFE